MKHWNTLTELENQVYRVREFKTLLNVTTRGIAETGSDIDEVATVLYTLLGMIEDIDSKLYDQFHTLWDQVRNHSFESERQKCQGNCGNCDCSNENDSQQVWGKIVNDMQKWSS